MEYNLILDNDALNDIDEAASWYEKQQKDLGVEFLLKFEEAVEFLQKNPKIFAIVFSHFRRMLLNKFPYAIYYSVNEKKKEVEVVAVFHTSRSSEIWKKRLSYS